MLDSLAEQRVVDLAELKNANAASRLQHTVSLAEDVRNVSAVSDSKSDRVKIDRVGLDVGRKMLSIAMGE